ncbi:MAG: MBL fold metallo-hydrolase [Clostridia bacterium]|nr:MBL fold metallo-hydrolase [Clostridia bacterium]
MDYKVLFCGQYGTNTYLISDSSEAFVIDPDGDGTRVLSALGENRLIGILLTHGHFDHRGAADYLRRMTKAPIYIGEADAQMCRGNGDLAFLADAHVASFEPDILLRDNDKLKMGSVIVNVLHTPGHSPGSMTFEAGGYLFPGDLIFEESIGRTDFGSMSDALASIARLMQLYDDDTLILPGHGAPTTIGHERSCNPYIR